MGAEWAIERLATNLNVCEGTRMCGGIPRGMDLILFIYEAKEICRPTWNDQTHANNIFGTRGGSQSHAWQSSYHCTRFNPH